MNVLVTGGTGTLGRHVVTRLRQSGHRARILSRHPRGHVDAVQGDLLTGHGIDRALSGMDAVVHAATAVRQNITGRPDLKATRLLLKRARHAGVTHFLYVSIVGIDGAAYPYYRTKVAVEAVVREGEVPWSILRATQFHDLMEIFLKAFSRVPGVTAIPFAWQFQPVDAREVANRVVGAVLDRPGGLLDDFGGPEIRDFKTIGAAWLMATRRRRRLVNLPMPFKFSRQWAEGRLTTSEHREGTITFNEYLAERYPHP
jgi:uncharacterized protein YbjT (DUF2867 family)